MSAQPPASNGNGGGTGQIIPFKQKLNGLRALLDKMKDQFAMALPSHIRVERLLRLTMTAVQKEPSLLDCHLPSFLGALLECAQLGLEPNTTLGHAWLIPFRNNKQNRLECQLIPGYKGLIKLAYQSGQVASIAAYTVFERDEFDYKYGLRPRLFHRPHRGADRGAMVAVYAVADVKMISRPLFRVLEKHECESIRDRFSKSPRRGPWVDNFEDMSMKSAVRRLSKWIPSDTEKSHLLARAVDHDERAEAGIGQEFGEVIDLGPEDIGTPEPEPRSAEEGAQASPVPEIAQASPSGPQTRLDQLTAEAKAKREAK
jgi:recombination protein RecT